MRLIIFLFFLGFAAAEVGSLIRSIFDLCVG
jgi:hypothetical protein